MMQVARSSAVITLTTWKALFLREAVNRLSAGRAAWLWLLVEPLSHIVFMLIIYTGFRARSIGGIDTTIWLITGMVAFFAFRRTVQQATNAINANKALFAYRQVKPADTVLVRAGLEGFLMTLVAIILLTGAALLGHNALPADPIAVVSAFFGMWLIGLGLGLVASVASELVQESGRIISMGMIPLYFLSGVIFPIASVPQPFRDWMLFNPLVHGLEAARLGFGPYYYAVPGMNLAYLYGCALVLVFFGLALQVRFSERLVAQ